jgi:hypothetical protein
LLTREIEIKTITPNEITPTALTSQKVTNEAYKSYNLTYIFK